MSFKLKSGSRIRILSRLALLSATLLWGSTFVALSSTNDFFKPNFLLACRFLPACLILCAVFFKRLKQLDKHYVKAGMILGLIMFAGYSLQAIAITPAGGASRPKLFFGGYLLCSGSLCKRRSFKKKAGQIQPFCCLSLFCGNPRNFDAGFDLGKPKGGKLGRCSFPYKQFYICRIHSSSS